MHRFQLYQLWLTLFISILCSSKYLNGLTVPYKDFPFPTAPHPLTLKHTKLDVNGDVPFPTGAWWTNFVLNDGSSTVCSMPYCYQIHNGQLQLSYPFRVATSGSIENGFIPQFSISTDLLIGQALDYQVISFDSFSTTLAFSIAGEDMGTPLFQIYLVRGSPYVTVEYKDSSVVLNIPDGLSVDQFRKYENLVFANGDLVDFQVYGLRFNDNKIWYIYMSNNEDVPVELQLKGSRQLTTNGKFTGILRIARCLDGSMQPYLLDSAPVYPVGGTVDYMTNSSEPADDTDSEIANVQFQWKTKSFSSCRSSTLLMLALPHHVDMLDTDIYDSKESEEKLLSDIVYASIRGRMFGILGEVWYLREHLPSIEWDFKESGLMSTSDGQKLATTEIVTRLKQDMNDFPVPPRDSYNFGKQIARKARLALIADRFDQKDHFKTLLESLKTELTAWLTADNDDHWIYDTKFGGLITSDGFHDQQADFGNGYYNDHHFHYGYFIYALATIQKYDPEFISEHLTACSMVIGDIGTPFSAKDSNASAFIDQYDVTDMFPIARHKDWYLGHSYASGLFPMAVGKSQESSSESINAYYSLALFASTLSSAHSMMDSNGRSYYQFTRLLLAQEIRATKKYYHMEKHSLIYEPIFSKNAMVGVVGEMSAVYSTWFGNKAVYVHGINMIPFTPITEQLLEDAYISYEYPLMAQEYPDLTPVDSIWRSVVVLDHAILNASVAWDLALSSDNSFLGIDTWNSKANMLYWIASRPSWTADVISTNSSTTTNGKENLCFGAPACNVAGANGTALSCCGTLPGCCPSGLGCCAGAQESSQQSDETPPANACYGETSCAVLGLGCCNTLEGCCDPDPFTGQVLGCCREYGHTQPKPSQSSKSPTSDASMTADPTEFLCHGEPACAAAGLDCCTAPGGCCPSTSTGPLLNCCKQKLASPSLSPPNATQVSSDTCYNQPRCAAAKLDCCATAGGCCAPTDPSQPLLDCCDTSPSRSINSTGSSKVHSKTCFGQYACLAANLACCDTSEGCCPPASNDPNAPPPLQCCSADATASSSAPPSPAWLEDVHTCHHEPKCLVAGDNGTPLQCCSTEKGCCPGFNCCLTPEEKAKGTHVYEKSTKSSSSPSKTSNILLWLVISSVAICTIAALFMYITRWHNRRGYSRIETDHNSRVWSCVALLFVVVIFFVFLIYKSQ